MRKLLFFYFFLSYSVFSQETENSKVFQSERLKTYFIIKELKSYRNSILNSTYSKGRLIYYLPHEFYIPLIYAYEVDDKALKNIFRSFLDKELFLKIKNDSNVKVLDKYIFYFFLAEFVRLDNSNIKLNKELFSLLILELDDIWNLYEGKVWEREKFYFKGKKERIYSILKNKNNGKLSYYKAITDFELFPLAMGSSLFLSQTKYGLENKILKEIVGAFTKLLNRLVKFYDDGTWVLQPNVWKDHRDYKNVKLNTGEDVVWDALELASAYGRQCPYRFIVRVFLSILRSTCNAIETGCHDVLIAFSTGHQYFDPSSAGSEVSEYGVVVVV